MLNLPTGTVTFLFTDIEGSTGLWEQDPEAMRQALSRHDALIEECVMRFDGGMVRPRGEGDSRFAVFANASHGVAAAAAIQEELFRETWPTPKPLRVRMALHTGEADLRLGDYYGSAVNRCARLRALAYGGQILLTTAVCQLAQDHLPIGVGLRELGEHRLKDLDRAERVFQLLIPGLPEAFPPLRSVDAFPNNLPLQLTRFIGHEKDITEARDLLSGTRLLTLTGSGGAGKTRLALQLAADTLELFKDGAWLVELAPVADATLVPNALAAVLNAHESQNVTLTEVLSDYLHDKQMLIILDNCEHLIMACAQLAETLLRTCPDVKILATSCEGLSVQGETAWRVPSLTLPDPRIEVFIESLARCEAIQLFMERAKAIRPDFELTRQNAHAVSQICRRLDGIPLAIELATTRIRGMSVEQIAARLDDRFRLLTGGSRTALSRHQTLKTLIDWSYGLLTEPERLLLLRLSVFVGGWTLEACEYTCCGDSIESGDVMDLLLQLVNKSLVLSEEYGAETRYHLSETIRQYAREKLLDTGQTEAMRDRHLDWSLQLVEGTASKFRTGGGIAMMKQRLNSELENLYSALEWASVRNLEICFRLARGILVIARRETVHGPLRDLLSEALDRDAANTIHVSPAARAGGLWTVGAAYIGQGENLLARKVLQQSLNIYRQIEDTHGVADALSMLAPAYGMSGEIAAATAAIEEAIRLYQQLGDTWGLMMSLESASLRLFYSERYEEARATAERTLIMSTRIGDRWAMINPLMILGLIATKDGDIEVGRARLEEGLAICHELMDPRLTATILSALGNLARQQRDYERASSIYTEVLDTWRKVGNRGAVALIQQILGYIAVAQGDTAMASIHFEESLVIRQRLDNPLDIAGPLEGLASLAAMKNDSHRAAHLLGAADAIRGENGRQLESYDRPEIDQTLNRLHNRLSDLELDRLWAEGRAMSIEQAIHYAHSADVSV